MIRKTLSNTQAATFCIELPNSQNHGMPTPIGTGFFVSPDGWFITAAHVITENNNDNGPVRKDIDKTFLMKEIRINRNPPAMCQAVTFSKIIPNLGFALLKVDFTENANKAWLIGKSEFPFLCVSSRQLEEGEPVYSFGYPLSSAIARKQGSMMVGEESLCPRVTSAIISSTLEQTKMVMTPGDPRIYVLDKALNYGNSGGPIISVETGKVHAFCSRFQPLFVPQQHLPADKNGNPMLIAMPSLYGVVVSLGNPEILELLNQLNVPITDE